MHRLTSLALLGLVVGCSPAAPPVETPKPPPPVASATPTPPPARAAWSFGSAGEANAQLDLGDKGVLQVGEHGRRWLFAKDAVEPQQAATIAPQDLFDARVEGAQVLLVGEQGAVYLAKDPLGEIVSSKPGPKDHKALGFRAGKQAVLGVEKNGTLHRTTDAGATWASSKLPLRAGEVVVGMAANQRGEALVVVQPQRALISTDDGATWTAIPTPGIGARDAMRDAKGDLYLLGAAKEQSAKLAAGKLEIAAPQPLVASKKEKSLTRTRTLVAGQRQVTLVETQEPKPSKKMKLEVAVAPLGKSGTRAVIEASVARSTKVFAGGFESAVVVGSYDDRADPPTTKFQRTIDDGKTWEQLGTLVGRLDWDPEVFVGPGQLLVGNVCDDETNSCKAAQLKVGNQPWKELKLPPQMRIERALFDQAHDRLWIVARHTKGYALLTGKLSEGVVAQTKAELPDASVRDVALDAKGELRVVFTSPLRFMTTTFDGKTTPARFPPFDTEDVDFAGERALAFDGTSTWETADGGEHWAKVPTGSSGPLACADAGCVQGDAVRIGWDLPDPQKELVAATNQASITKDKPVDETPVETKEAPLQLTCTPTGPWKKLEARMWGLQTALDGDVRFVAPHHGEDGSTSLVVARGAAAPTKLTLLGPKAKGASEWSTRNWTQATNEGFVGVRYTFGGKPKDGTKYAPVDVELAWYSAATGKVSKAKLPQVSPFRVGRSSASALHAIVEGGLLFLPHGGDGLLTFVRDNGKAETMPRPPEPEMGDWTDAFKKGEQIVLSYQRSGHLTFAFTKDAGKTWSTTTWSLGAPATLGLLDGKMTAAMRGSLYSSAPPTALFSFDAPSNDPPEPLRLSSEKLALGPSLVACTPKTRAGLPVLIERSKDHRGVSMALTPAKGDKDGPKAFALARLTDRVDATGLACNDGLDLEIAGGGDVAALVAPHDLAHGWLLRSDGGKEESRPISCK